MKLHRCIVWLLLLLSTATACAQEATAQEFSAERGTAIQPQSTAAANSAPTFSSAETGERSIDENAETGTAIGLPVTANDVDSDPLEYSLNGDDAAAFTVNPTSGQLFTSSSLDYELQNVYSITVTATDGKAEVSIPVMVSVANVDEAGVARFEPAQPQVGQVLRVKIDDPDRSVSVTDTRWTISDDGGLSWDLINTLRLASQTPDSTYEGSLYRVELTYNDGEGTNKQLEAIAAHAVAPREVAPQIAVSPYVSGLSIPWDITFTPDGTMIFTERAGQLKARLVDGTVHVITADMSDLYREHNTGLMGIAIDPNFSSNRRFYTCQGHTIHEPYTKHELHVVAWAVDALYETATRVIDPLVGSVTTNHEHSGCRLRFGPQGYLWVVTGDAQQGSQAQDLNSLAGKTLRVDPNTGEAAPGNPFSSRVYSYGHRNPQGLALRPGTDQMWMVEHGPYSDDEINLVVSGGNYGWNPGYDPQRGYDDLYNERTPMTDLAKFPDAVEAKWSSGEQTIAPSGGIFLEGSIWGSWEGRLAVGVLKDTALHLFKFDVTGGLVSETIVNELNGTYGRLRTPMIGPDQALYVTTSNGGNQDQVLRVTPQQAPVFDPFDSVIEMPVEAPLGSLVASVNATDFNDDVIAYTLAGADSTVFEIVDPSIGDIRVAEHLVEDAVYDIEVIATDTAHLSVRISLSLVAIENPAILVTFSSPTYSVIEGKTTLITVELDRAPERDLRIPVSTTTLNGSSRHDWFGVPTDLLFDASTMQRTFSFRATDDPIDDDGESVLIHFGALPANVSAGVFPTANVALIDNDESRNVTGGGGSGVFPIETTASGESNKHTRSPEELAKMASERFEDIDTDDYYSSAVGWMLEHGITTGCADASFCSENLITRQQFVTFLWRAAGVPDSAAVGSVVFDDVSEGSYADAAIGWAVEQGITVGCNPPTIDALGRFCPNAHVSRAQASTFLYRYVGSSQDAGDTRFKDVPADAYYRPPVAWMDAHGITTGCADELFCSHNAASRAHVATFIYRVATTPASWGEHPP